VLKGALQVHVDVLVDLLVANRNVYVQLIQLVIAIVLVVVLLPRLL
jgi:hypothetical protein